VVSPVPKAIAGPGPRTMANSLDKGKGREPLTIIVPRKFADLEADSNSEDDTKSDLESGSEYETEEKKDLPIRPPQPPRTRAVVEIVQTSESSKRAVDENVRRRKTAANVDHSETETTKGPTIKSRPPPVKPKTEKNAQTIVPTGELYDRPCSSCVLAKKKCEKQGLGTACVACRKSKHKCEYSQQKGKGGKSKTIAESEDDDQKVTDTAAAVDDAPVEDAAAVANPRARKAAKTATKAITKAIQDIESASLTPKAAVGKGKGRSLLHC
jgi:hypothetical protein